MKHNPYTNEKSQIVCEILSYLVKNPHAKDTLKGIVEWWLLEQTIERETAKVKEALAELIAKGLVLERKRKDSQTYYQINRRKYKKILALLKEKSD